MAVLDVATLAPRAAARLLTSLVVPRPIAWASTVGLDGSLNLAPFSFFNAVGSTPPTVMISIAQRSGRPKDTLRNIQETGEFVVNLGDEALAEQLLLTSGEYDYTLNEFELAKLETAPSLLVKPPRVALAPAALEVKLTQMVAVTETSYTMVIGRVLCYHVRDDLLRPNGLVDASLLHPLARLGGDEFAAIGHIFELLRPVV